MVEGEQGDVVGVIREVEREPDVLHDDLRRGLGDDASGEHCVGDAPAAFAAGAGLLRDGKEDALLESTSDERSLSVARAPRDTKAREVDFRLWFCLEDVDDAADGPGPRGHGRRGRVGAVEGVEIAEASAGGVVLLGDLVVVEHDGGDVGGDGEADTTHTNHGGEGAGAVDWQGDAGVEGNGVSCVGDIDYECLSDKSALYAVWSTRKSSQFVFLEELAYFIATARPCLLGVHWKAVDELERIW